MLSTLEVKVRGFRRKEAKMSAEEKKEKDVITNLLVRSPFLDKKLKTKDRDEILANLNPFWAMLRCKDPKSLNNMVLETVICKDLGFEVVESKIGKPGTSFIVEVPILRNTCNIEKGEILTLPFYD